MCGLTTGLLDLFWAWYSHRLAWAQLSLPAHLVGMALLHENINSQIDYIVRKETQNPKKEEMMHDMNVRRRN